MLSIGNAGNVYLACGSTDMRRSIDGLAAIVQEVFFLDPFSSNLFVFCNKNRDRLKILHWEHNGFWLYFRRLERGKFRWPSSNSESTMLIGSRELNWLLDGLSIDQKQAHAKVDAKAVI
jgi:transposase